MIVINENPNTKGAFPASQLFCMPWSPCYDFEKLGKGLGLRVIIFISINSYTSSLVYTLLCGAKINYSECNIIFFLG